MAIAFRGRALWLPPLLLLAGLVLLASLAFAIANLDRGEETLPVVPMPGGDPGTAPFGPTGEQFTLIWRGIIAGIFIAAIVAAILGRLFGEKLGKIVTIWELVGYAFGIGVIGGLVIFWPAVVGGIQSLFTPGGSVQQPGAGGGFGGSPIPVSTAFPIALVIFAVLVVAGYAFFLASRIGPILGDLARKEPERERRRLEAAGAVRRTLLDLESGTDFRTAVMACYQRMCSLLATKGVGGQETLTAREIEGLALSELGLSQGSVDDLTGLFEEARYSRHEIGPAQRDRAVESLHAIRRELEG